MQTILPRSMNVNSQNSVSYYAFEYAYEYAYFFVYSPKPKA